MIPSRPKTAPVTIVEFTGLPMSFCKRIPGHPQAGGNGLSRQGQISRAQYPLPFHTGPNLPRKPSCAPKSRENSGKCTTNCSQPVAGRRRHTDLRQGHRSEREEIQQCLAEHKTLARIDADIADGQRYGVRGTPQLLHQRKPLSGAQPFDAFKTAIDEELAKKK